MSVSAKAVQEPTMVTIPEGWFLMGSESGQENERPVHRVWVDSFELAKCQVTNAEYTRYLAAGHLSAHRPQYFDDPNFSDPEQPIVAVSWFDAMDKRAGGGGPLRSEWVRAAQHGRQRT